jgi:site-specific recombinase XerD
VFVADGKGGHQRLVPMSGRLFASIAAYLDTERRADADSDRVVVVLRGSNLGRSLTATGLEEILDGIRVAVFWRRSTTACRDHCSPLPTRRQHRSHSAGRW